MAPSEGDRVLVEMVFRIVAGLNYARAAPLIEGVHPSDLSRWESGRWESLSRKKRAEIEGFFAKHGGEDGARAYLERELRELVPLTSADAARVRDLARRILEIVEGGPGLSADAGAMGYARASLESVDRAQAPRGVKPGRAGGETAREGGASESTRAQGKE